MENLITFRNATLGYGKRQVLSGVNLIVKTGDFLGIVGPNGAGKTTLLKAILGMLKPQEGTVARGQRDDLQIGYVPQREGVDTMYPLTVMDIVLMGRYSRLGPIQWPGKQDIQMAMNALEHAGITELAGRPYRNLSGGQKQRALIARALVGKPNLLILDEPTNGMDLVGEKAIMDLVRHLHNDDGLTVLMVSHLLNAVVNYAHRIAIVGDGSLREGIACDMITEKSLGELYGIPVQVAHIGDRMVVLPANGDHATPGQTIPAEGSILQ